MPEPGEKVERMTQEEADRRIASGEHIIGPFRNWNKLMLWKGSYWVKEMMQQQAVENAESERERCPFCGEVEGEHFPDCVHFEVPTIDPEDLKGG
jgi:hypothetical protein